MADTYSYTMPSDHDQEIVVRTLALFSQLQTYRNTFASQWEEVADLVLPTSRNTFYYGSYNWPGQKKTDRQVDATAMMALHRFGAICDSLLTPRNQIWHALTTDDPALKKRKDVRQWYEDATTALFQYRYDPIANFSAQNQNIYQSLGAFGTGAMFVDQAVNAAGQQIKGLRYKAVPLGEIFLMENHQGLIDSFIRWFRLTPLQAVKQFGREKLPAGMLVALEQQSQQPFDFLHYVCPRVDLDPERLDAKGKPFASYYISMEGQCLLSEGGYTTFPMPASRYDQTPGEVYGRSPAMMVLPAIKTLNAEKRTFLKQGHRAADPVLLTADDGLLDGVDLTPGAMNKGGMTSDGKPLVTILPTGQIQVNKEMMDEERALINDAFMVSLFQILQETPQMTATEVIERVNEKGILLAPTVGRQQNEYLGPMIDRELDLLSSMGVLPPMPQALVEARGAYRVEYTSPLAKAARAQEVSGALRTLETAMSVVNATQDPTPLDTFKLDVMFPEIAVLQGTPERWIASPQEIAQKRQNRLAAQQQQAQIQAMPAQAAMIKAQAVAQEKGGDQSQQGGDAQNQ
jgi:hypothetical protein